MAELREAFGDKVREPIPQSTIWAEATRLKRMVYNFAPDSSPAKEAMLLVARTLQEVQRAGA